MDAGETWVPIPGRGGYYEASDMGRVRSLDRILEVRSRWGGMRPMPHKGRVMKTWPDANGYATIYTSFDGAQVAVNVHRLICEAFHGPSGGLHVNHKDGDKSNNRAANLEWVTRSGNMQHAYDTGLHKARKVVVGVPKDGGDPVRFLSVAHAARAVTAQGGRGNITSSMKTPGRTAYGYHWRFDEAA